MKASHVTGCRSCGSSDLAKVLDLGSTPIANALVAPEDASSPDISYPLNVVFCRDCALVQLGTALPAEAIFGENYPYFSSFSAALCQHAQEHVEGLIVERNLGPASLAVEIASNDGYLLQYFVAKGIPALGVDPSAPPAQAAIEAGVPTLIEFFGTEVGRRIAEEHGAADVVIANNVMAHVPDLNDFVGGFAALLSDDGVLTVENPYVRDMIESVEFDTIYHEHYCYFSCSSVDALMARHGLHLNDVEYFPGLHGGTLRYYIAKRPARTAKCQEYLDREQADGMTGLDFYAAFAERVTECQQGLLDFLHACRAEGRRVVAYGAAAKGATLLNSTGIGTDLVEYVVDRSTFKQGKSMPGCRLPIVDPEVLLTDRPDDLLLLAWNFATEICEQQAEFAAGGGRFIVPVPLPRIL